MCDVCQALYGHLPRCPYADDRDPDRQAQIEAEIGDIQYDLMREEQS